jgi:ribosomal protein S18 acetylase RimI-like enzyme
MGDISTEEQIGRIGSALDEALGKLRPALIGPVKTSIKDDEREGRLQVIRLGEVAVVGHIPDAEASGHQVWMELRSLPENGADESPDEELSIREIAAGDALGLQRFYNTLDSHARTLFRPMGWNALYTDCEKTVRNALAGKRYDLVVDRGGEILGWAFVGSLEKDYPGFGIAVSEKLRGQGLGAKLTMAVVEFVRRHGNKGIFLTVVQSNDRARVLYEKFGFKTIGTRIGGDGLDYFDMRLDF